MSSTPLGTKGPSPYPTGIVIADNAASKLQDRESSAKTSTTKPPVVDKNTPYFTFDALDTDVNLVSWRSDGLLESARRRLGGGAGKLVNGLLGGHDDWRQDIFVQRDNDDFRYQLEKAGVELSSVHGEITVRNTLESGMAFAHIVKASFKGGFADFNFIELKRKYGLTDDAPFVEGYRKMAGRYQVATAVEAVSQGAIAARALKAPPTMPTQLVLEGKSIQHSMRITGKARNNTPLEATVEVRNLNTGVLVGRSSTTGARGLTGGPQKRPSLTPPGQNNIQKYTRSPDKWVGAGKTSSSLSKDLITKAQNELRSLKKEQMRTTLTTQLSVAQSLAHASTETPDSNVTSEVLQRGQNAGGIEGQDPSGTISDSGGGKPPVPPNKATAFMPEPEPELIKIPVYRANKTVPIERGLVYEFSGPNAYPRLADSLKTGNLQILDLGSDTLKLGPESRGEAQVFSVRIIEAGREDWPMDYFIEVNPVQADGKKYQGLNFYRLGVAHGVEEYLLIGETAPRASDYGVTRDGKELRDLLNSGKVTLQVVRGEAGVATAMSQTVDVQQVLKNLAEKRLPQGMGEGTVTAMFQSENFRQSLLKRPEAQIQTITSYAMSVLPLEEAVRSMTQIVTDASSESLRNIITQNLNAELDRLRSNNKKVNLQRIDLSGRDLRGLDLRNAHLQRADFSGSNLQGANFQNADLSDANLEKADLRKINGEKVNLSWAKLTDADLRNSSLKHAQLARAKLQRVDLSQADLSHAKFTSADLTGAKLTNATGWKTSFEAADLTRVDLAFADLRQSEFDHATLINADFQGADLQGASLAVANLQEANMTFAKLEKADLSYANLQKADLTKANLKGGYVNEAKLSEAKFVDADLTDASFLGAKREGANFEGANTTGVTWPRNQPTLQHR